MKKFPWKQLFVIVFVGFGVPVIINVTATITNIYDLTTGGGGIIP